MAVSFTTITTGGKLRVLEIVKLSASHFLASPSVGCRVTEEAFEISAILLRTHEWQFSRRKATRLHPIDYFFLKNVFLVAIIEPNVKRQIRFRRYSVHKSRDLIFFLGLKRCRFLHLSTRLLLKCCCGCLICETLRNIFFLIFGALRTVCQVVTVAFRFARTVKVDQEGSCPVYMHHSSCLSSCRDRLLSLPCRIFRFLSRQRIVVH